jgi:hypothetical protein
LGARAAADNMDSNCLFDCMVCIVIKCIESVAFQMLLVHVNDLNDDVDDRSVVHLHP